MSKRIEVGLLLDYYGSLLSEAQFNVVDMYYNQDLSLSEISSIMGITRQGVHDSVRRAEALLIEFEDKLKMKSTKEKVQSLAYRILDILSDLHVEDCDKLAQARGFVNDIIKRLGV